MTNSPNNKAPKSRHHARGFTLIEIMVVIVIIGIILTFVMLSFGDFGAQRRLNSQANHFAQLVKLLRLKAIIGADTYGIDISDKRYRFYQFVVDNQSPYGRWIKLSNRAIFKPYTFSDNTTLELQHKKHQEQPDIIVSSSGDISPFVLTIKENHAYASIKATGDETIVVNEKDN